MESNCSHHAVKALDPAVDPAYHDGFPPRVRRVNHAGEVSTEWPVVLIPGRLKRLTTISIEALEDALEREAAREEGS